MSRRRSAGSRVRTDSPSSRMSPPLISIMRLTSRIAVVLPHPDGPTSTQTSPAGTSKLRSWIAGDAEPAYVLETLRNSSVAACGCDDDPSAWAVFGLFTRRGPGEAGRSSVPTLRVLLSHGHGPAHGPCARDR